MAVYYVIIVSGPPPRRATRICIFLQVFNNSISIILLLSADIHMNNKAYTVLSITDYIIIRKVLTLRLIRGVCITALLKLTVKLFINRFTLVQPLFLQTLTCLLF